MAPVQFRSISAPPTDPVTPRDPPESWAERGYAPNGEVEYIPFSVSPETPVPRRPFPDSPPPESRSTNFYGDTVAPRGLRPRLINSSSLWGLVRGLSDRGQRSGVPRCGPGLGSFPFVVAVWTLGTHPRRPLKGSPYDVDPQNDRTIDRDRERPVSKRPRVKGVDMSPTSVTRDS